MLSFASRRRRFHYIVVCAATVFPAPWRGEAFLPVAGTTVKKVVEIKPSALLRQPPAREVGSGSAG
ncbi:MAG TPA: hypothetical protein VF800_24895, partial [Telluria sp.]